MGFSHPAFIPSLNVAILWALTLEYIYVLEKKWLLLIVLCSVQSSVREHQLSVRDRAHGAVLFCRHCMLSGCSRCLDRRHNWLQKQSLRTDLVC